jgi:gliding-associated putative ABC transporter substrate-binding component GldG
MIISGIRRATQSNKPRIAFLQGHGELTLAQTQRARTLISPYYTVEDITLNDSIDALNGVRGLVIARPRSAFSEKDKYIIDQFVMNGGRLMCFVDKLSFEEDTLLRTGVAHTTRTNIELDKMLYDYGIKVNDNYVFDVRCAPKAIPASEQGFIPWFFFIRATQSKHPIARNIDPVLLKYASEIQFVGNSSNVASPILTSSTNSSMTGLAPMISLSIPASYGKNPMLAPDPEDENNKLCLAGLVEGKFTSHYKNRIVDAYAKNKLSKYKESSTAEGKVLVVGNGTFLQNRYDSVPDKMTGTYNYIPNAFNELKFDETVAQMQGVPPLIYGNQEFFQNMVDYMMGDNSVLDLRSKQIDIHAIDKEKVQLDAGFYKFINMLLPSGIILVFAGLMLYLRKRKYTRN